MKNPFASRKFAIAVIFLVVQAITFFTPDDIDRKIEAIAPYTALVAVAAIFQKDPQVIICHPGQGNDDFAKLKGKPILIGAGGR